MMNVINIAVCYILKAVKKVNPKSSHHQKKKISISLMLYLYEMTDVH